ncbi:hypothetical protein FJZ26_00270 [Candidatus Parvarchaeota archaeon]|nr:hypothetical protein [Candidatus Parvarchaeota archaeon]
MADKLERIYTVNLSKAYSHIRTRRARYAMDLLENFVARHMKAEASDVRISNQLNGLVWSHGMEKPPRKIKIRAVKEGLVVKAGLVEEKPQGLQFKVVKKSEKKAAAQGAKEPAQTKEATAKAPAAGTAPVPKPAAQQKPSATTGKQASQASAPKTQPVQATKQSPAQSTQGKGRA